MQVINSNIMSLNAQRSLGATNSNLSTALERLSTGLRINSAKDDAAGLAISERFTAQIRGLNQGVRNANDAVSLSQTAEGALTEVTNNLQRIRELAVQSANATNSASDRTALDAEAQQLLSEIDRISSQTTFNGINLLDGSFSTQQFQIGANVGETISIASIANSSVVSGLGIHTGAATVTAGDVTGGAINSLTVNGNDVADIASGDAASLAAAIEAADSTVSATASNAQDLAWADLTAGAAGAGNYSLDVTVGGSTTTVTVAVANSGTLDGSTVAAAISSQVSGLSASFAGGNVTLSSDDGSNFTVDSQAFSGSVAAGALGDGTEGFTTADVDGDTYYGNVVLSSNSDVTIAGADVAAAGLTAATTAVSSSTTQANVLTVSGAENMISKIDSALDTVNGTRANLGAIQNRFESAIANMQTTAENLSASRSRIQDADFAAETANLSKVQIMQQAGVAMLAQANSAPQLVLSLLR